MANRSENEREWRHFDDDDEFRDRRGALDRRWGYGERLGPGYRRQGRGGEGSEFEMEDDYSAPDYWVYQEEWMRPGPFTGVGPRGYRRSDERIFEEVCDRLAQHAQIDASDMEVEVHEGEVTLKGTVEDRRIKRMAETSVEAIPGVVDVHNRLRLKGRQGREEEREAKETMENPFPGGPVPTGPAATLDD